MLYNYIEYKLYNYIEYKKEEKGVIMKKKIYMLGVLILIFILNLINYIVETQYGVNLVEYFTISKPLTKEEQQWLKNHGDIIYGADKNAPPLRYVDTDNQYKGIFIDYLNSLSIESGLQIEVRPLVWDKALAELKNENTDICDMFPSTQRSKNYLFSNPIYKLRGVIVTNESNKDIANIGDLKDKTIAVQLGDYTNEFLEDNVTNAKYIYVADINEALKLLKNGEADAVVGDEPVCSYFIQENNYKDDLKIVEKAIYENDVVLAVPKSHEMLVNIINKGIYSLNKNNIMEKMQQKWFGISATMTYTGEKETYSAKIVLSIIFIFILFTYLFCLINRSLKNAVTDRTKELNRSKNELQAAFDVFNRNIVIVDSRGRILNGNRAFYEYCNFTKEESSSKRVYEIDDMFKYVWETIDVKNNKEIPFEFNYNNRIYTIHVRNIKDIDQLKNNKDEENKAYDMLITVEDITNRKATEKQLLQSEKMAAIGQLAAGIAHEIRNPLGVIRNYCYLLKGKNARQNEEIYQKSIDNIELSVERASGIIDNLLNFSAISGDEFKEINIREFLLSILQLEKKSMKEMNIEATLSCENIFINTNEESLKHIFINLITNAVDSMPNGGIIEVTCINKDPVIQIDITDTGIGIEKHNLDNIFNPFFTTKNPGKGTGLGLFIVYNEVEKLGGSIKITRSEINKGTTFRIEIPIKGDLI